MKKLMLTLAAVIFSGALAYGSSITPFSGPQDPSQIQSYLNQLIGSIKTGVNGYVGGIAGAVSSSATTAEQTLASVVVPANTLAVNGQSLRLRCSGVFGNTTHTTTSTKLYYGTSSVTTGGITTAAQAYDLELFVTYNASATSATYVGHGQVGTTSVTTVATTNTTDNMASALTARCTATQGVASAADVVNVNFIVEQIK